MISKLKLFAKHKRYLYNNFLSNAYLRVIHTKVTFAKLTPGMLKLNANGSFPNFINANND